MLRILSISTLFPNPARPAFGKFVGSQMRAVAEEGSVDLTMIAPIGVPPWPLNRQQPYATHAACPPQATLGKLSVLHPRFLLIPRFGAQSNPARIARAVLPLARHLHGLKPFDLVDAQFFFPDGPAAAIVARELGLPLTIKSRGSDIIYWQTRPKALRQMQEAADYATLLLTVSQALGRDMAALGMAPDKIVTHYTGLDRAKFHPLPRGEARQQLAAQAILHLPDQAPLLVAAGSLIAIKGQSIALEALAQVPDAHLALAGVGPDEAALRAQAAALGLSDRVHFLGQVSHDALPLLMAAANALVLPSEREGLANVWVESLACGAPLVIPDIGGAREVVTSPSAGRIVPRDAAGFAQGMRAILDDNLPQAEVAAHADGFSWQSNARRLIEIWHRAAGH